MSIHSLADVQSKNIGVNTSVWQFCVILPLARIGSYCNICSHVFIENDVIVGDRVTIKSGVQLWDGIRIFDDVFVGPNVTFANDIIPRSKRHLQEYPKTSILKGASIGANATILPGIVIGEFAMIGAGSVVTKDVKPFGLYYGNPASQKGYVTMDGVSLDFELKSKNGLEYIFKNDVLILR